MAENRPEGDRMPEFGVNGAVLNNPEMTEEMRRVYSEAPEKRVLLSLLKPSNIPLYAQLLSICCAFAMGVFVAHSNELFERVKELPLWAVLAVLIGPALVSVLDSCLRLLVERKTDKHW